MGAITVKFPYFFLQTAHSAYLIQVEETGHLAHIHYGGPVALTDGRALAYRRVMGFGSEVLYDEQSKLCLDNALWEWSGVGRGDFRPSPLSLTFADGSDTNDFLYDHFEIRPDAAPMGDLPSAHGPGESLILCLKEAARPLRLLLYYTVFFESDVICRRAVLFNDGQEPVTLHRFMSFSLDLPHRAYQLLHLAGDWNREAEPYREVIGRSQLRIGSTTGHSSNRHNPAFAVLEAGCGEDTGRVIGCNLFYSGNHTSILDPSSHGLLRIQSGIQPDGFHWTLAAGDSFESPQAALTYSDQGLNGMSAHFHRFIHEHVIPPYWRNRPRPILLNSWEAFQFRFQEGRLLRLAKLGQELGMELFVLDDGWFENRNDDCSGLGDYAVDHRKLPDGLGGFAEKLKDLGMDFGLWFEPESVSPDSALYRAHPDYAIALPDRPPLKGRHQYVLDLSQEEVQGALFTKLEDILDQYPIRYVKWDMNRHMSDLFSERFATGELVHRYYLGLYRLLHALFDHRPALLLEMCASGGNRFDLGMLTFAPQIWASDDTDPIERVGIQKGYSYFYPPSTIGAHVSAAPHSQTLRWTPLSTRFHVAAFGILGYELDLTQLSPVEKKEIGEQVAFYKRYRSLLQFGSFRRYDKVGPELEQWSIFDAEGRQGLVLLVQALTRAIPESDWLRVQGADPMQVYRIKSRKGRLKLSRFGHLLDYVLPVPLKKDGWIMTVANRHYAMEEGVFEEIVSGRALKEGICLPNQYLGTGYHKDLRMWGDFGSQIYTIEALREEEKMEIWEREEGQDE